jgi:hypothetical protein
MHDGCSRIDRIRSDHSPIKADKKLKEAKKHQESRKGRPMSPKGHVEDSHLRRRSDEECK